MLFLPFLLLFLLELLLLLLVFTVQSLKLLLLFVLNLLLLVIIGGVLLQFLLFLLMFLLNALPLLTLLLAEPIELFLVLLFKPWIGGSGVRRSQRRRTVRVGAHAIRRRIPRTIRFPRVFGKASRRVRSASGPSATTAKLTRPRSGRDIWTTVIR